METLFLICALSLPSSYHTWPRIVSWQASVEEDELRGWIRKNKEIDEVFITPEGQSGKLKEYGWERVPFTINGKQVWIQRKPSTDKKKSMKKMISVSA